MHEGVLHRIISVAICILALCLCLSCDVSRSIEVTLAEDHPWEIVSGRRFWYTIIYADASGVHKQQLPIGSRSFTIDFLRSGTTIIAAYPLGSGIPLGGAHHAGVDGQSIELTFVNGPLARNLIQVAQRWPKPVSQANFTYLANEISYIDPRGLCIDWTRLSRDVVEGRVDTNSFISGSAVDVAVSDIPPGRWVSEAVTVDSFYAFFSTETTIQGLTPGVHRFLNLDHMLELRIVIPDDPQEDAFWHAVPVETLLRVSDSTYQELLEGGG